MTPWPRTHRIVQSQSSAKQHVSARVSQLESMSTQTNRLKHRNRFLFVSLFLWLWFIVIVWVAESYPTVGRGWAAIAFPKAALASLLVAFVCCFAIRRQIYPKDQQRTLFIWLPLAGLWGTPILFGIILSLTALNGCLDNSLSERHASELIVKRSTIGRGWYSRSLVVRDWRQSGQTVLIGGRAAAMADDFWEPGQKLQVTTRKGFFNAEWIVAIDEGTLDKR